MIDVVCRVLHSHDYAPLWMYLVLPEAKRVPRSDPGYIQKRPEGSCLLQLRKGQLVAESRIMDGKASSQDPRQQMEEHRGRI